VNWISPDDRLRKLHDEMCAELSIVIGTHLDRERRIAGQVKIIIRAAGGIPCDEIARN
jgi:hypothetical protein